MLTDTTWIGTTAKTTWICNPMQNAVEPDSTIPYLPLKGAITIQLASKPRKDNSCHLNCQRVLNRNSKNGFPFTSSNQFYNKCYRNISNIRHTWICITHRSPCWYMFHWTGSWSWHQQLYSYLHLNWMMMPSGSYQSCRHQQWRQDCAQQYIVTFS